MNSEKSEHITILEQLFESLPSKSGIKRILDAGSGKTSLNCLLDYYPDATVDAVVFPGDERKIKSVTENVKGENFRLIEKDICSDSLPGEYDLVLAHLLLGEAVKWGNSFSDLLDSLLSIKTRYLVIVDFLEDPSVNYSFLEEDLKRNNRKILNKIQIAKQEPQEFTGKKGQEFVGKTYVGYAIL